MNDPVLILLKVLALLALVVLNGFFVAAELALVQSRSDALTARVTL